MDIASREAGTDVLWKIERHAMKKQDQVHDQHQEDLEQKKLRKRERRLVERLEEARTQLEMAQVRLQRAEDRVHRRQEKVRRLDEKLAAVRQALYPSQQEVSPVSIHEPVQTLPQEQVEALEEFIEAPVAVAESVEPAALLTSEELAESEMQLIAHEEHTRESSFDRDEHAGEIAEIAIEQEAEQKMPREAGSGVVAAARAVAVAAEQAVRIAAERALSVATHLRDVSTGRHLGQELAQLQSEVDKVQSLAQEARHTADEAQRLSQQTTDVTPELTQIAADTERQWQEISSLTIVDEEIVEDEEEREEVASAGTGFSNAEDEMEKIHFDLPDIQASRSRNSHALPINLVARVEEIDEDERALEAVTAMIIAEAAGIAAAEAEALAEASSARTREARVAAQDADRFLKQIKSAIHTGTLKGEEASAALRHAEQEVTRAHAALADAEAAEERALQAARNAEAEAEVAEGMALSADMREVHEEHLHEEQIPTSSAEEYEQKQYEALFDTEIDSAEQSHSSEVKSEQADDDETVELPTVRSRPEQA